MVADLSERAAAVHSGMVDPSEDNMLKITGDGRKLGLSLIHILSVYSVRQGYAVAGRSGRWKKQVNAVNRRTAL